MDTKNNTSQNGNINIWSEKLYTQREVDVLHKNWDKSDSSLARKIENEKLNEEKQNRLEDKTVAKLVKKSNRILVSISAIFPFDLFPDSINVEDGRITIIKRNFFSSSQVHSIDIKDISNIFVNVAPLFAQLVIVSRTYENNEIKIKYLRKKEAVLVRIIIEGLRIFEHKQIDTSSYSKEELLNKLKELSTTKIVT